MLIKKTMLYVIAGISLAGCNDDINTKPRSMEDKQPEITVAAEAEATSVEDETSAKSSIEARNSIWVDIPVSLRFPGISKVEAAATWLDRLSRLSQADQKYLNSLSNKYFTSLIFESAADQKALIDEGYPMPEEWLAARAMGDQQLKELSDKGNIKAQLFYADRLSSRLQPIQAARQQDVSPPLSETEIVDMYARATTAATMSMRNSTSPFAAYVYGQTMSSGTWGAPPEPIAAAMQLAKDRGDIRASAYLAAFSRQHPDMDAMAILASYDGMKVIANARP